MTQLQKNLEQWAPLPLPGGRALRGCFVQIEPYEASHLPGLYAAVAGPSNDDIWTYMPTGPFHDLPSFNLALTEMTEGQGWAVMVIRSLSSGNVVGMASYMRQRPDQGSAEIGMVAHGPAMRRTPMSTEAHFLLARHVFQDLGYRRYEWKCNAANAASHAAAKRYGFTYEGTFRQDMVVKGQNRDTAWYSMIDREWPTLKRRFETWLGPDNFDASGAQITRLGQH